MFKQLKYTTGAVAALAALSLGGAAIAGATGSQPNRSAAVTTPTGVTPPTTVTPPESTSQTDGDNIQSGDQTTPDTTPAGGADTASAGDANDTASESPAKESGTSETAAANDGPGGHADEPGSPNANTDQQGQN